MIASILDSIKAFFRSIQFWIIISPWEQGIRVRFGKWTKKLNSGTHFKIPIFDRFYVQSTRMRITGLSRQTVTSLDGKTVTLNGNIGYCIEDIETLYNTIHHAEDTIQSIAKGIISDYVSQHNVKDCTPNALQEATSEKLQLSKYGLGCGRIYITDFAVVRTYRLIGDTMAFSNMVGAALNTDQMAI